MAKVALLVATALAAASSQPSRPVERPERPWSVSTQAKRQAAQAYSLEAWEHHEAFQFSEAERAARKALEFNPHDLRARYVLGVALLVQRKQIEEAIGQLRQASAVFAEAHLELSRFYLERGRFREAMHELNCFTAKSGAGNTLQLRAK